MHELMGDLVTTARQGKISLDELVTELRKQFITSVLQSCRGNQCRAAMELGMHRNTLSRTVKELQVPAREIRGAWMDKKPVKSVTPPNVFRVRGQA